MRAFIYVSLFLTACTGDVEEAAAPDAAGNTGVVENLGEAPPPAPAVPDTPEDVAAPPEDALKTESGLAYKVLKPGTGEQHPGPRALVEVHYTGWTTDGEMFDSSLKRGRSTKFGLNQVIPGWAEGLQLMSVGEQRRMWIPAELAYNNQPGKPAGMLVFDVELIDFTNPPEDLAAPPADAVKTESGLAYKVLKPGTGTEHPTDAATVQVHFTGWSADGSLLQSTEGQPRPAQFRLSTSIPGWREGLKLMTEGETARLWIPEELAKVPGAPAGDVVFDFTLLKIDKPIPAPSDVAAPPVDAERTESGLAYKVLKPGTGEQHPEPTQRVKVHYTGWTTDGEMFDSSVQRGNPATFPLDRVIAGWTEGVALMVVGEKTRLWIPEELAYKGKPNAPHGMLVFDVELLEILPDPPKPPGGKAPSLKPKGEGVDPHGH